MKNVSSLKSNKVDSPKTPGGISKSLLTPCRRVGLSRNWKKGGVSPFVSPVPGCGESNEDVKAKRKIDDVDLEKSKTVADVNTTPRNVDVPRRKKSKILPVNHEPSSPAARDCEEEISIQKTNVNPSIEEVNNEDVQVVTSVLKSKSKSKKIIPPSSEEISSLDKIPKHTLIENPIEKTNIEKITEVDSVTPILKSKIKLKKFTSPLATNVKQESDSSVIKSDKVAKLKGKKNSIKLDKSKKKSPENLTKECIVIIQKKIFKDQLNEQSGDPNTTSQNVFDSDSDDVPLCQLNKIENEVNNITKKQESPVQDKLPKPIQPRVLSLDEDDDFVETGKVKVQILEDKTTSTTSLKKILKKKPKENKKPILKEPQQSSQSSEDDDFDLNCKRTILIRKTYDKVTKPLKAKSTGSITQKDIEELQSRIEVKKKLLLAKAMTQDTEELRELIKKWQKGCQDALTELIEMMRHKFPDKQNMDFSEMLQMLKIPKNLVGYDEENDCFNTPDDASIILGKFNDL